MGQGSSTCKKEHKAFNVGHFLRAAKEGDVDLLQSTLKTKNSNVNASSMTSMSALHLSCKEGHVDVTKELLERKADLHQRTLHGNTALHIAALHGQDDIVRLLLDHGAEPNITCKRGYTPIYLAVMEGRHDVVRELLKQGANVSIAPKAKVTLMEIADVQGDHDMKEILSAHKWASSRKDMKPTTSKEPDVVIVEAGSTSS